MANGRGCEFQPGRARAFAAVSSHPISSRGPGVLLTTRILPPLCGPPALFVLWIILQRLVSGYSLQPQSIPVRSLSMLEMYARRDEAEVKTARGCEFSPAPFLSRPILWPAEGQACSCHDLVRFRRISRPSRHRRTRVVYMSPVSFTIQTFGHSVFAGRSAGRLTLTLFCVFDSTGSSPDSHQSFYPWSFLHRASYDPQLIEPRPNEE